MDNTSSSCDNRSLSVGVVHIELYVKRVIRNLYVAILVWYMRRGLKHGVRGRARSLLGRLASHGEFPLIRSHFAVVLTWRDSS
jgi:hypothetical protein